MAPGDPPDDDALYLPPTTQWHLIARQAAHDAIVEHLRLCPLQQDQVVTRLRQLEGRFLLMVGLMIGSGLIGGTAGAALIRLVTP